MTEEERWVSAQAVILRIHAITGWTIPVSEFMNILVDQFQLKLNESYANVTVKEIEYAFRNKGIEIKDWGKAMNLALIDEVMIPYLETRYEISRVEEQKNYPKMIEQKTELTDEEKADWICDWKSMADINLELIPLMFYEFLNDKKIITITADQKWQYTKKAQEGIKAILMSQIPLCKTSDALSDYGKFEKMEKDGFTGEFKGRILNRAKRLIVFDYLKDLL